MKVHCESCTGMCEGVVLPPEVQAVVDAAREALRREGRSIPHNLIGLWDAIKKLEAKQP